LPEEYFDSAVKKAAMLTCKIALPDRLTPPNIISRIPDFGHFALNGMNSVFAFNKGFFSFLAAGFCPKNNFSVCPKMMALPDSLGCSPPTPCLVRLWGRETRRK